MLLVRKNKQVTEETAALKQANELKAFGCDLYKSKL